MAHNINTYIGRAAAWHQLGTVTGQYETTESLLSNEGFQYHVFKSQLRDSLGREIEAYGTFRMSYADMAVWKHGTAEEKQAAMLRSEFLGAVGADYKVIQHRQGFATIDALMQTATGAHYETAGVLGAGEKVWALADLGLAINVGGDTQKGYLLFSTGHDGSMSHSYRLTFTRVICQNTLNVALNSKTRAKLTVRHTKNADIKLDGIRDALMAVKDDTRSVEEKMNWLASRKVTRESMTAIMDRLFPKTRDAEGNDKETTRRDNILSRVLSLYESNDGNAFPEQRGTVYNLLNAVTNYTDHERSAKDDQRALSAMFGSGDALKGKALELCVEMAGSAPAMPKAVTYAPAPKGWGDGSLLDQIVAAGNVA